MPSVHEPTEAEVHALVTHVLVALRAGQRLPLTLRVGLGITAAMEAEMRQPVEVEVAQNW